MKQRFVLTFTNKLSKHVQKADKNEDKVQLKNFCFVYQKTNKNTNWKRVYYILTHFSLVSEKVNRKIKSIFKIGSLFYCVLH